MTRPPGPRGFGAFGALRTLNRDPLRAFADLHARHGDVLSLSFPGLGDYWSLLRPEGIRRVLVENEHNYGKSANQDGVRAFVGEGILMAEGEVWKRHRRMMQPAFHRSAVAPLVERMAETTDRALRAFGTGVVETNLHHHMTRLTLAVVGRSLFDVDCSSPADGVGPAVEEGIAFANRYAISLFPLPLWLPTPRNLAFKRARARVHATLERIVRYRRAEPAETRRSDLLDLLLAARDDVDGGGLDDRQLRDEMMTALMAGHETTACALSWLFWLLARHPAEQERLRDEARSVLGGRLPTMDDLPKLARTAMAIKETLRLYPSVWILERDARGDDEVAGFAVRKGTTIAVSPWLVHRDPRSWDDPERFDPERFADARVAARPKTAWIPFGTGPRFCIGHQFALSEATVVASMLLSRYRVELDAAHPVVVEPTVTLRPRDGLRVRMVPVDQGAEAQAASTRATSSNASP
jgi:cytochrome P450